MTKGDRIKQLREQKDISQTELAERVGTTKQNIYKYETGVITNIPSDKIEAIAQYFNVSPSYIMGWESDFLREPPQMFFCKYYHSVSAGIGTHADENADTYGYYFSCQSQAEHCFAVDVQGDSMTPKLLDGDIAIVDTQAQINNGDIVVFYDTADDLGYIKRINKSDSVVMFISDNPSYAPMVFPLSDIGSRIQISGRVIAKIDNNF